MIVGFLTLRLELPAANLVSHHIWTMTQWDATVAAGECTHVYSRTSLLILLVDVFFVGLMQLQASPPSGSLISRVPTQSTVCSSVAMQTLVTATAHIVKMFRYSALEVSNLQVIVFRSKEM